MAEIKILIWKRAPLDKSSVLDVYNAKAAGFINAMGYRILGVGMSKKDSFSMIEVPDTEIHVVMDGLRVLKENGVFND